MNKKRAGISKYYGLFLKSFETLEKDNLEKYKNNEISYEIYNQIFKIRNYSRNYSKVFNRKVNQSISNIFQDIIAYYLKIFLNEKYDIILEEKENEYVPDILIKKNKKNHFIIELKTNLGYCRNAIKDGTIEKRICNLAKHFNVNENNIIYILETPGNVSKAFLENYYDRKTSKSKIHPKAKPYNYFYPLFNKIDPKYMKEFRNIENINDNIIKELFKKNAITYFEDIIKLIK